MVDGKAILLKAYGRIPGSH